MRMTDIISKKRDGGELSRAELDFVVTSYTRAAVPDYQVSALLMAIYFRGMSEHETSDLTLSMLHSGSVIDFKKHGIDDIVTDKHSTGGVGDKVSLALYPITAALGVKTNAMCGRGLGHTGGTIDKLESIAGYNMSLGEDEVAAIIKKCGYCVTQQTRAVAPADGALYALRDVTGTVESIPLITASILSKKAAEGSDALVFDVKCGSGAFMKDISSAKELAKSLTRVSALLKKKSSAIITDMNTPLGSAVGNFLEVEEAVKCLSGEGPDDVMEVVRSLAVKILLLSGVAEDENSALKSVDKVLADGSALDCFYKNIAAQGGDVMLLQSQIGKYRSPYHKRVSIEGKVLDADTVAMAALALGAGREKKEDSVCPTAGILINRAEAVADLYAKNDATLTEGANILSTLPKALSAGLYGDVKKRVLEWREGK